MKEITQESQTAQKRPSQGRNMGACADAGRITERNDRAGMV